MALVIFTKYKRKINDSNVEKNYQKNQLSLYVETLRFIFHERFLFLVDMLWFAWYADVEVGTHVSLPCAIENFPSTKYDTYLPPLVYIILDLSYIMIGTS